MLNKSVHQYTELLQIVFPNKDTESLINCKPDDLAEVVLPGPMNVIMRQGGHTPPTHLIDDGCYGTVTLILFLAGLFYEVTSKDNYQRTLLTNYQAERINLAEDLAPSLSHIKDIELDR